MYRCLDITCNFHGDPVMVRNRVLEDWQRRVHNDHRPVFLPECPECGGTKIELTDEEMAREPDEAPELEVAI